tara:strand:- start:9199 stop:9636 length:438 start_codon:yes stop_codon:yes gene_type:complete
MIKFLKNIFNTRNENTDDSDEINLDLAIIVILLRASSIDGSKDELELSMIKDIAVQDLNIEEDDFIDLYSKAIEEEDFSADIYKWTKIINDNCDEDSKLKIFRLACKIVNADGNIDPFESNFTRRLSGLLYINDKQAGEIKKEFN